MKASTPIPDLKELLGQIYLHLQRSSVAYKDYLEYGRTFLHAQILRVCNLQLRELIMTNRPTLPATLQQDALELVAHYDTWMKKWDELEATLKPQPNDEFIFENNHRFPKEAATRLENAFLAGEKDFT